MDEQDDFMGALMGQFMNKTSREKKRDEGEGDYQDFLWQYLHALNHGATDDEMMGMAGQVEPERRDAMSKFAGGTKLETSPFVQEGRAAVNNLFKRSK